MPTTLPDAPPKTKPSPVAPPKPKRGPTVPPPQPQPARVPAPNTIPQPCRPLRPVCEGLSSLKLPDRPELADRIAA